MSLGELASRANELCELREVRTFRLFVELVSLRSRAHTAICVPSNFVNVKPLKVSL